MMKKRIVAMLLLGSLLTLPLSGCTNKEALENEKAYRTVGINDLKEGKYEDAIKAFDKALAQKKGSVTNLEIDICYYKALAQFKNGDSEDAISTYTSVIEYDDTQDAYYLRGNVYLQENQIKKAISDFDQAIERAEDFGEMSCKVATALLGQNQQKKAKSYLKAVIQKAGTSVDDYYNVGNAYYLLEDYDTAIDYLEKAKSKRDDALLLLAKVYLAKGETGNATAQVEEYSSVHENDSEALNLAGCVAMANEDYETAASCFQKGLKVENPSNAQELLKNEIAAYEYLGDYETASTLMEEYLKKYPEDQEAVRENTFISTRITSDEES